MKEKNQGFRPCKSIKKCKNERRKSRILPLQNFNLAKFIIIKFIIIKINFMLYNVFCFFAFCIFPYSSSL